MKKNQITNLKMGRNRFRSCFLIQAYLIMPHIEIDIDFPP
jgi:hypothetical protein